MGYHLRTRLQRKIVHRLKDLGALLTFIAAVCNSYRLAELLPLTPLVLCLGLLSMLPDWVLGSVDAATEWALCIALGGKRAKLRDAQGHPTGERVLYSVVGALDPNFNLPDPRLLCVPASQQERELSFPSPTTAGWGNAAFMALCMKLAYEDWQVVRDVINHEWRMDAASAAPALEAANVPPAQRPQAYLTPRFIQGSSFHFMQPAGAESNEELSSVHLDSDAMVLAVEDTARAPTPEALAAGAKGAGVALVLAFRGTEPLELADFQSDFDAVPEAGEWGCLHPGFLLALGLDPNLNPYHQTLVAYSALRGEERAAAVVAGKAATPYEVLRDLLVDYMSRHPAAKLYITGHSLGGALAVVFAGALMHDSSSKVQAIKPRVGALFTFGQPRVGDFEFLCHLQVSLLEPSASTQPSSGTAHRAAPPAPDAAADGHAAAGANGGAAHHTQHALSAAGASKLRALMGKAQNEAAAPPLTSRYIRVVNTFDIVPHIPPTLCNIYQHGGDLLYLQMTPGSIRYLTEQPMFFITGIWSSSLVKLHHHTCVLLGLKPGWKGRDNYLRYGMRWGSVLLPWLMGGLNDHLPVDYVTSITNSQPTDWIPFKQRRKLSRWAHAVMFTRALAGTGAKSPGSGSGGAGDGAGAPAAGDGRAVGGRAHASLSSRLQAQLLARSEKVQATVTHRGSGAAAAADAAAADDSHAVDAAPRSSSSGGGGGGASNNGSKLNALAHKAVPRS